MNKHDYKQPVKELRVSLSEDNLDDDGSVGPSRRKTKKKHIRRRSGSLSRVLTSMGKGLKKALKQDSTTPGSKIESIHSTPLPAFGGTPDFPSPRGSNAKRKANAEHELSPSNKSQKRTFESTFTPNFSANNPRLPLPSGAQLWRSYDHRKST